MQKTPSSWVPTAAFTALALFLSAPSAKAYAIPASDFSDPSLWTPIYDGLSPAALDTVHQGFTISVPTSEPWPWTAGYKTAFTLQGDFTVDADFALEYWPQANHVRIGINFLIPTQGAIERTSEGWGVAECYIFDGVGQGIAATDDTTGTLRLTRNGSTLAGYYLNENHDWEFVGSGPVTTADAVIALIAWPDYTGGGEVKVTFDNPVISTGGYAPFPAPAHGVPENLTFLLSSCLLLPLVLQRVFRLKRPRD